MGMGTSLGIRLSGKHVNGAFKMFERSDSSSEIAQMLARSQSQSAAPSAASYDSVTPAIAKSISADTESAQAQQLANRQRLRGVSSTYLRGASTTSGGKTKLGQ